MAKDIYMIEYAPEFRSFSREALYFCLGNGAAKLAGVISKESIARLSEGVPTNPELLKLKVPEVDEFCNLVESHTDRQILISDLYQPPFTIGDPLPMSHIDESVAPDGISLLIPYKGDCAFFGAQDERFGELTDLPSFMAVYGIGDAMLVRQHVIVDGKDYPSAHHLGLGRNDRSMVGIDLRGLHQEVTGIRI